MSALREALRKAEAGGLALTPMEPPAAQPAAPAPAAPQPEPQPPDPDPPEALPAITPAPGESRTAPYLTLAFLGFTALAAAGYIWMQLRPATSATRNAPAPATRDSRPATIEPAPTSAIAGPARPAETTLHPAAESIALATMPAVVPAPASAPPRPEAPTGAVEFSAALPASRRIEAVVHPKVEAAYAALQSGNLDAARQFYRDALADEPLNRDALLGLAAVEKYAHRESEAETHLRNLQRAYPDDAQATAALISLRATQLDPLRAESRLKSLLTGEPEAAALHFALGNQYARQGRWAEARQAYQHALSGDPGHPDFAFNLAVSLDRLQLDEAARRYYARALALGAGRLHAFDPDAARRRLHELAP